MDTRGKKDGELQLAFMKNACDAARQDLTDFPENGHAQAH